MMTSASEESEAVLTKPAKEVLVVHDDGYFTHSTGDTYDGGFDIKKKDLNAKMMGPGTYTTAEGDVYTGTWEYDKLGANEPVTIKFADASTYEGSFREWCYNGSGKYTYPDESVLSCTFGDNCPTGQLVLTDPNEHSWLGKADQGFGWFAPVNHFYTLLDKRATPKIKQRRRKAMELQNVKKF